MFRTRKEVSAERLGIQTGVIGQIVVLMRSLQNKKRKILLCSLFYSIINFKISLSSMCQR